MRKNYKLSPSDLTFLWDECPRCFFLKYAYNIKRPASAFPSIFGAIDRAMKEYYGGRPTSAIDPSLPPGRVMLEARSVESELIEVPGSQARCYLSGKFDKLLAFDDGGYGVVDFKTSDPKPEHVSFYSRQLHAYALALERPAPGKLGLRPITLLGLLSVTPRSMELAADGRVSLLGSPTWQEVPRDDGGFLAFLGEVVALLEQPEPPEPGEKCEYCRYREGSRQHGW